MRSVRLAFFLLPVLACSGRRASNATPHGGSAPSNDGAAPSDIQPESSTRPVLDFEVLAGLPDVPESQTDDPPYDQFTAASVIGPEVVAWSRVDGKEVDGKSAGEVVRLNLSTRARTSLAGAVWGTDARIFEMNGKLVASGRTLLFENDDGTFGDDAHVDRTAAALSPSGWLLSTGTWGAPTSVYRSSGCSAAVDVERKMNKGTAFVAAGELYFIGQRVSGPTLFRVAPGDAACGSTTAAAVAKDWKVTPVGVVGSDDDVYVLGAAEDASAFGVSEFSLYSFATPSLDLAPFVERLRTFESSPALAKDRSNIYVGWGDGRIDRLDLSTKTRTTLYQASRRVISLASDGVSVIFTTDVGVYRKRL